MTSLENYSELIDGIFGAGTTSFDNKLSTTNRVIGALNHAGDFSRFKNNFTARLKRLHLLYGGHSNLLRPILIQVNEIASEKNWQGAFAELAAFDHFNNDLFMTNNFLFDPIIADVTLPKEQSFANELNKKEANLDGYLEEFDIYFDIKVLKDNVTEILDGIYKQLKLDHPTLLNVSAEYDLGISYGVLQSKRKLLLNELSDALRGGISLSNHRSKVIPDLSFVFTWKAGVSFAIRSYSPFRHAENHHKNIFIYANKFLKAKPTLIVLVNFPWYNQILNQSPDIEVFQRSYARRVFCQYKNNGSPFSDYYPDFSGTQSIFEVSTHLSGIVFLNDNTILSDDPESTNVTCSIYLNPNAKHQISRGMAHSFLTGLCNKMFDDFEDDNY